MNPVDVDSITVIAAAAAAFVIGGGYYGLLGKHWMRAARIDAKTMKPSVVPFVTSFAMELVIAYFLTGLLGHLTPDGITIVDALATAFFVWLAFVATTIAVNHRYQGFGWDLTLIDAGHWLLALLGMAAVIGWLGG